MVFCRKTIGIIEQTPTPPFLSYSPRTPSALGSAQTDTSKKYYKKITHSALPLAATTKMWYHNTP